MSEAFLGAHLEGMHVDSELLLLKGGGPLLLRENRQLGSAAGLVTRAPQQAGRAQQARRPQDDYQHRRRQHQRCVPLLRGCHNVEASRQHLESQIPLMPQQESPHRRWLHLTRVILLW